MRRRGVLIVLATVVLTGAAAIAFLAAGQRELLAPALQQVAPASAVTATALAGTVYAREGADRLLQRERTGHPCSAAVEMGCPPSTPLRSVPMFLVRDSVNAIRAFIAQDPRNGCALDWRIDVSDGAFYDTCHGSLYDRQGRRIGGPSPWNLNEWAVLEKDGAIFIDPTKILTGAAPGFYPR